MSDMKITQPIYGPDTGSTFLTSDHLVMVMATQMTRTAGLARPTLENH